MRDLVDGLNYSTYGTSTKYCSSTTIDRRSSAAVSKKKKKSTKKIKLFILYGAPAGESSRERPEPAPPSVLRYCTIGPLIRNRTLQVQRICCPCCPQPLYVEPAGLCLALAACWKIIAGRSLQSCWFDFSSRRSKRRKRGDRRAVL
jgi:hypothetical protein